ncbi:hypothetical protein FSPOR_9027 [Fusarium sporotrichioides]|uniref:Hypervirulence associated protein TUDOR domain-containing protein n=1 Tax=Fusarium sporotrichioides TaxID=5514 RepID=A0A395RRM0_FUSSP|nr:hypothetical protein FSPOR_9027 [Fusarium sporotrichioides]
MKGNDEVIQEFNEVVNMTASELEKWLKSDDSNSAGWPKEDENGESVGHGSGRKIVEILKENPKKDPSKYTDEQVQHMRKVVSYCKRHLAQETKANNDKSPEEVKKTKSYASLKNWGHDFLKAQDKENGSAKKQDKEEEEEEEEEVDDDAEEEQEEEDGDDEKQTGEKRRATRSQTGSNKKRETRKGESTKSNDEDEDEKEDAEEEGGDDAEEKPQKKQSNGKKTNGTSKKSEEAEDDENDDDEGGDDSGAKKGPKKGETVSWNWGEGQPKGKVLDVKAEDTSITTKNGNTVSRKGDEEDPAVVLDTGKNKAIKKAHELN